MDQMEMVAPKTQKAFRSACGVSHKAADEAAKEIGDIAMGEIRLTEAVKNLTRLVGLVWGTVLALIGTILFLLRQLVSMGE